MLIHLTEILQYKNNENKTYKRQTTMKMKVSGEWTEQKNGGNDQRKYAIRGFEWHLPSAVSVSILMFSFLHCCCVDCLKISAKQQWKWSLTEN